MKKIPTLFKREFKNHRVVKVLPEFTEGLEWFASDFTVIPTVKIDGSCCAIINGELYKRFDAKKGFYPHDAIKCQDKPDPVTGHWPMWLKCDKSNPSDKWFFAAYEKAKEFMILNDGTYEAIGKHFNGNPYKMDNDILNKHGDLVIGDLYYPYTYEKIKEWLEESNVEGIVFWKDDKPVCKIKRSDFGFKWPV